MHKDAQIHDELRKINEAEIVYRDLPPNGTANWVAENREVAVPAEGLGLQTTEIVSYPYSNVTLRGVVSWPRLLLFRVLVSSGHQLQY